MFQRVLTKIGATLEAHGLLFASFFLLIFIPLYPKLPLFDAIPGYLVRVRLEDILVLMTGVWWLIQSLRGRIIWRAPLLEVVALYVITGAVSLLSAVLLLQTVPLELLHIGKSGLHFFRYLEYFSLFFFMFSSITSIKQSKVAIWLLSFTVVVATIYGAGQKYWSFPVYSTMNREFSKGAQLSLSEFARVPSTFGGHYDLAAYLVIVLPLLLAVLMNHPWRAVKLSLTVVIILGCWLLFASGSKTAFLALILGMYLSFMLSIRDRKSWFKGALWGSLLSLMLMLSVGGYFWFNTQDTRLVDSLQSLQNSPIVAQVSPLAQLLSKTERVFNNRTTTNDQPFDLVPDGTEATWSENALKYGLSMGIRLDTLWPQAVKGLARSLPVGSGYGTLNKTSNTMFVEADSTDNNFLRTLGETGILGFVLFYGTVILCLRLAWIGANDEKWLPRALSIGFIGGTIGLLGNALIIDVFVASKVAFTYWAIAGLVLKVNYLNHPQVFARLDHVRAKSVLTFLRNHWAFLVGGLLLIFLLQHNPSISNSRINTFSVAPDRLQAITTARCWLSQHHWQLCRPDAATASPTSYVYGGVILAFYTISHFVGSYYYANLVFAIGSFGLFYHLAKVLLKDSRWVAGAVLLVIVTWFLSQVVFAPLDVNATVFLSLAAVEAGRRWREQSSQKWLLAALVLLGLSISTWPSLQSSDWKVVAVPFFILGLATWLKPKLDEYSINDKLLTLSQVGIVSVLFLSTFWLSSSTAFQELIAEYRGSSPALRLEAVRVIEGYGLGFREKAKSISESPYLFSTINPYFYDIYSQGRFRLLPLSPQQAFASLGDKVWSGSDNLLSLEKAKTLLKSQVPVFVSEFDVSSSVGRPEFEQLKLELNLDLVALGCNEDCNLYQVSDQPAILTSSPSLNNRQVNIGANQPYSFIIYPHRFNVHDQARNHSLLQSIEALQQVSLKQPDVLIITGDTVRDNDLNQVSYFNRYFGNAITAPLYYNAGNFDELARKPVTLGFQQIVTPRSLILLVQSDAEGNIDQDQQRAIYNSLLDVEKYPEITSIFVVSHRLAWLGASQGYEPLVKATHQSELTTFDSFFQQKLIPKLAKLEGKKSFLVSGDLQPQSGPAIFYDQDDQGISYIATAVNNDPSDVYLQVEVDADGQVKLVPISPSGRPLNSLENYGVEYWRLKLFEVLDR